MGAGVVIVVLLVALGELGLVWVLAKRLFRAGSTIGHAVGRRVALRDADGACRIAGVARGDARPAPLSGRPCLAWEIELRPNGQAEVARRHAFTGTLYLHAPGVAAAGARLELAGAALVLGKTSVARLDAGREPEALRPFAQNLPAQPPTRRVFWFERIVAEGDLVVARGTARREADVRGGEAAYRESPTLPTFRHADRHALVVLRGPVWAIVLRQAFGALGGAVFLVPVALALGLVLLGVLRDL